MCYDNRKTTNQVITMNDFTQSGIFRWMSKLGSFLVLSMLWLLCCVPVVTIIPSCVALYDTAVCCLHQDEDGPVRHFFVTLKTSLLRGIGLTVLWLVIAAILYVGYRSLTLLAGENTLLQLYATVYAGSMLIPLAMLTWLIPLEARSSDGFWALHKLALTRAIFHLPTTAALLGILILTAMILFIMPVLVVILPAIAVTFQSALAEKVLDRYALEDSN